MGYRVKNILQNLVFHKAPNLNHCFSLYSQTISEIHQSRGRFYICRWQAVIITHRDLNEANVIMQRVIERISGWCHDNGLVISPSKIKIFHVRPKRLKIPIKYLGVHVDEFLNWNIEHLQKKIRQGNYILRNLYYIKNKEIMKNVYYAIVESHLRYGITAWGSATCLRMLKILHNRIINLLSKAGIKDKFLSNEKIYKVCLFNEFGDMKEFNILVNHRYETKYKTSKKLKLWNFLMLMGSLLCQASCLE